MGVAVQNFSNRLSNVDPEAKQEKKELLVDKSKEVISAKPELVTKVKKTDKDQVKDVVIKKAKKIRSQTSSPGQ